MRSRPRGGITYSAFNAILGSDQPGGPRPPPASRDALTVAVTLPSRGGPRWWRRPRVRFVAWFLIACLLTLGLELLAEHAIHSADRDRPGLAPSVFELNAIYQAIVASGPRTAVPRFSVVVALDPSKDPSLLNVCEQRAFLARLINAIAEFSPALIVVDKYFGERSCPPQDPGTAALRGAIDSVSPSVPIVVGRRVEPPARRSAGPGHEIARLVPSLRVGPDDRVHEGVLNVDPDTRRLPLGWTVRAPDGGLGWRHTLALEAAVRYDGRLLEKNPRLDALVRAKEHPYIGFLSLQAVEAMTYSSDHVLCASRIEVPRPASCVPADRRHDPRYFRGRIVVLGEINLDLDGHFSVVGEVPGYVLQVNYIEALLDGRYFWPVPRWANYASGLLIYFALHWVLVAHHHAIQRAAGWRRCLVLLKAVGWVAGVIVATIAALYLVIIHAGWYLNPSTIGLLAVVIKVSELVFPALTPKGEPR